MRLYSVGVILVCAALCQLAAASSNSLAWRKYKQQYGKVYQGEEDTRRLANFLAKKQSIERHNANSSASFKMGLNHMSDWAGEQFKRLNGFNVEAALDLAKRSAGGTNLSAKLTQLLEGSAPVQFDWRKVPNRVTPVKDQGSECGSCWAFATTGLLEGQEAVHNFTKEFYALSEQELVDCSAQNGGCNGGVMLLALQDIHKLGGIESEQDYKYQADDESCRIDKTKFVLSIKGGHVLRQGDEESLKKAVANYGPVAVAIDATRHLQDYESGVLFDPECRADSLNHGVLVVGYGHDSSHGDYWIIKNSWGANWGEKGYFRLKRGVNMCGVAEYPTLADF